MIEPLTNESIKTNSQDANEARSVSKKEQNDYQQDLNYYLDPA